MGLNDGILDFEGHIPFMGMIVLDFASSGFMTKSQSNPIK